MFTSNVTFSRHLIFHVTTVFDMDVCIEDRMFFTLKIKNIHIGSVVKSGPCEP